MKFSIQLFILFTCFSYSAFLTSGDDKKHPTVKSVLMVCSGNYALSPMAEAVFKKLAKNKGVDSQWSCDSAGLDARPGENMSELAAIKLQEHGIEPDNHTVRQLTEDDLNEYDYALAMDRENLKDMIGMALVGSTAKLELLPSYDPQGKKIIRHPDVWAGLHAYEEPYQIINRSCNAFLDRHSNVAA
jgi:protein-tyrosine-phosphatase